MGMMYLAGTATTKTQSPVRFSIMIRFLSCAEPILSGHWSYAGTIRSNRPPLWFWEETDQIPLFLSPPSLGDLDLLGVLKAEWTAI
jgi:hypothetical protein